METKQRIPESSIISYEARLIRNPLTHKAEDWQKTAHHWMVTINGVSVDYYTGLAHRTETRKPTDGGLSYGQLCARPGWDLERQLSFSEPEKPKLDDVVYSLIQDSQARGVGFEEWCSDFGYVPDSRKAWDLYLACQAAYIKLQSMRLGVSYDELATIYEGY